MDVATGARVECADGPCGQCRYVILDPAKAAITHVVVGDPAALGETRLVPLEYVLDSTPKLIRLSCTREEFEALPQFSKYEYVRPAQGYEPYSPGELWMGPLEAYWQSLQLEVDQQVPEGELSIQRGAPVEATNGHVGIVEGFLAEAASGHITHLVLEEGHLWGRREVLIPAAQIDRIEDDTVFLRINRETVVALPPFHPGKKEVTR
jgi:hypothetical protein